MPFLGLLVLYGVILEPMWPYYGSVQILKTNHPFKFNTGRKKICMCSVASLLKYCEFWGYFKILDNFQLSWSK